MAARIYKFPEVQTVNGYKIPLYSEEEIEVTVLVVNHYGDLPHKVHSNNLTSIDPVIIINSLNEAKKSKLFSFTAERIMLKILSNVEVIPFKEYM